MPTTLPYLLQEPETGLYLARLENGEIMLRRDPRTALRFESAEAATEFSGTVHGNFAGYRAVT